MNRHKCDMCGLYLIADGEACQECIDSLEIINKVATRSQTGAVYERNEIECNDREDGDKCKLC
jgi:hypothetical protein